MKAPGAGRIAAEAVKAGGEKMAEMLLKIWHQEKVTNRLVQKYDQPSTRKGCKLNPVKLPSNFPDSHPGKVSCKIDDNIDTHLSKQ